MQCTDLPSRLGYRWERVAGCSTGAVRKTKLGSLARLSRDVGADPNFDLAIIKMEAEKLTSD
jgi:hypothetical protein